MSFYERHQANSGKNNAWRSEPQLVQSQPTLAHIPQPPPRINIQLPSRRASCASDYASNNTSKRSSLASTRETKMNENKMTPKHQHSNSCGSLSTDLLGPVIMGPSISLDDWIPEKPPERPPKNPHLRVAYPDLFVDQRVPSPDLPPPSPPTVLVDEYYNNDEPLPPPPSDLEANKWREDISNRLNESTGRQMASPQVQKHQKNSQDSPAKLDSPIQQTIGLPERNSNRYHSVRTSCRRRDSPEKLKLIHSESSLCFSNQKRYAERSNSRYPSKKLFNGSLAISQKTCVSDKYRAEPLRPHMLQTEERKPPASLPSELRSHQRASIAEGPGREAPPPLQPRQMRINQSMRARISDSRTSATRISPPREDKYREIKGNINQM